MIWSQRRRQITGPNLNPVYKIGLGPFYWSKAHDFVTLPVQLLRLSIKKTFSTLGENNLASLLLPNLELAVKSNLDSVG